MNLRNAAELMIASKQNRENAHSEDMERVAKFLDDECAKGNTQATWPGSLPPFVIMKLEGLGYTIESHDDQRDGTCWTTIYWDRSPGGWSP